jgi:S-methylmethionine-dependent homocysteine/selenocysteine methylase
MESEQGRSDLDEYFQHYIAIARRHNTGLILEAPTWRASAAWGEKLGYNTTQLDRINHVAIDFLDQIRQRAGLARPFIISGCIGPRYDGYNPECELSVEEARRYHAAQIKTFSETRADIVTAMTITSSSEAAGIVLAAKDYGQRVVISFTTETDGRLPSGESLRNAIEAVDRLSDAYPLYYMINCSHPTHFGSALEQNEAWVKRIGGIRANASSKSHAELDESTELDNGNPRELGLQYKQLKQQLRNLHVVGGCCGTNHEHIAEITQACFC